MREDTLGMDATLSVPAEMEIGPALRGRFLGAALAPLRVRNFVLLFSGQMISTLGDMFYAVALPWLILTNGGTPQDLGIVLAAYGVPRVGLLLVGGVLSDRLRPRRMMLLADAARALLVGLLAALALWGQPTLWQLCAIGVPLGAFTGLFLPALLSVMPEVLPDALLPAGNALNSSTTELAGLVGPGIGGVVVGSLKSGVALAVDALSFLVSTLTLAAMGRGRPRAPGSSGAVSGQPAGKAAEAAATISEKDAQGARSAAAVEPALTFWQLLRTSRLLQAVLAISSVANLTSGMMFEVALPTLAKNQLAAGASGYGLLLAAYGGGAFVGSLGASMMGRFKRVGSLLLSLNLALAGFFALIPFTGGVIGAVACLGVVGVLNGLSNVSFFTLVQQRMPRHLLGRVMGTLMFASLGTYPLSVALGGVVVARLGPVVVFPAGGILLALAITYGFFQREVREL